MYSHFSEPFGNALPGLWYGWVAWSALVIVPLLVVFFFQRRGWKRLSSKLRELPPALVELQKPGVVHERLSDDHVQRLLELCCLEARATFTRLNEELPANWLISHAAEISRHAASVRDTLSQALRSGQPQSLCLPVAEHFVYILGFPGRHEYSQLLRRHGFLAQGWLEHARAVRGAVDPTGAAGLLCLLFFFRPDAGDGIAVFGWDSSTRSLTYRNILDEQELRQPCVATFEDYCPVGNSQ